MVIWKKKFYKEVVLTKKKKMGHLSHPRSPSFPSLFFFFFVFNFTLFIVVEISLFPS